MNKLLMVTGTLSMLLVGACTGDEVKISEVIDATQDLQTLPPDVSPEMPEPLVYDTDAGDTDAVDTDAVDTDAGDTDAGDTDAGDTDTDAGDSDTDAGDSDTDAGDTDAL